jgi:hypothetical protein
MSGVTPTFKNAVIDLLGVDGFAVDLTKPDDNLPDGEVTTVWNTPRDMKVDVAIILIAAFDHFKLDVKTVKTGVFEQALLVNPDTKKSRPVVSVERTSDVATRKALGELDGVYDEDDPRFNGKNADGTPLLQDGATMILKNQASLVTVDVTIYDLNQQRADQMYLLIKTIMFASQNTFKNLGYINPPLRTAGTDSQSILDMDAGGKFLFERTLTYQGEHLDYIGGIDALAQLIAFESELVSEIAPDNPATTTVNLGPVEE